MMKSERNKARYEWYKAHHICPMCARRDAVPRMVFCGECLDVKRGQYDPERTTEWGRARRARLIEAGLCVECARNPARYGRRTCEACYRRKSVHDKSKYWATARQKYRTPWICRAGGCEAEVVDGKHYCAEHLAEKQERMEVARLAALAKNKDHPWRMEF